MQLVVVLLLTLHLNRTSFIGFFPADYHACESSVVAADRAYAIDCLLIFFHNQGRVGLVLIGGEVDLVITFSGMCHRVLLILLS